MKVQGGNPRTQVERVSTPTVQGRNDGKAAARVERAGGEQVRVSDLGKKLAAARSPESPDAERIERLRGLVESGKLTVDPAAIADAMLREER